MKYLKTLMLFCIACMLFASCHQEVTKSNYTDVIPANATEVMAINLDTLLMKADAHNEGNKDAKDKIAALLFEKQSEKLGQKLSTLLGNHLETGIDWKAPIYLFEAPSMHTKAATLKINNFTTFNLLMKLLSQQGYCTEPGEMEGHYRTEIKEANLQLAYNDGTLLAVYHEDASELQKLSPAISGLMKQTADKSIQTTDHWKQLTHLKADVRLLATPDAMPIEIRGMFRLPQGTQLVGGMLFEQGKLVALLKRSDFNGDVYISATPYCPQNNRELQAALNSIMRGRPFHMEFGNKELMTLSNLHVLMEFSPNDPEILKSYQLIQKIEKLTLQGDNNLCVLTIDLNDKRENALKQLIGFGRSFKLF